MKQDTQTNIINLYNCGQRPIEIALNENVCIKDIFLILTKADSINLINLNHSMPYISKRDAAIVRKWNSMKYTYQLIAEDVGLTRERVRQILAKAKRKGFKVLDVNAVSKNRSKNNRKYVVDSLDDDVKQLIINEYHSGKIFDDVFLLVSNSITHAQFSTFVEYAKNQNLLNYKEHVFGYIKSSRDNPDAVTEYRESVIMKMRAENRPLDEIADKLDISKIRLTQVIRRMKNKGIIVPNSRTSGGSLTEDEIESRVQLIDAYLDDGLTVRAISALLFMAPQHVAMLIFTHLVPK
jgi:predicted transcriptional regulator